jgi:hypothetical protein
VCQYVDRHGKARQETFKIHVRSPYLVLRELVKDPEFAKIMNWYPCRRYISINGAPEVEMRDDIECGRDWHDMQVSML